MKNLIVTLIAGMILTSPAKADGFICLNEDHTLKASVFHKTHPTQGTRNPSILILSNPKISSDRKTIAKFDAADGVLEKRSSVYTANVDLRFANSSRKGEYIGGTRLGAIDVIKLDIDYSVAYPIQHGDMANALLSIYKRNGDKIAIDMLCKRYLKN